jgi:hypothetical protein
MRKQNTAQDQAQSRTFDPTLLQEMINQAVAAASSLIDGKTDTTSDISLLGRMRRPRLGVSPPVLVMYRFNSPVTQLGGCCFECRSLTQRRLRNSVSVAIAKRLRCP